MYNGAPYAYRSERLCGPIAPLLHDPETAPHPTPLPLFSVPQLFYYGRFKIHHSPDIFSVLKECLTSYLSGEVITVNKDKLNPNLG